MTLREDGQQILQLVIHHFEGIEGKEAEVEAYALMAFLADEYAAGNIEDKEGLEESKARNLE
eukprot:2405709-Alexandrium_andersonii.AAC.1